MPRFRYGAVALIVALSLAIVPPMMIGDAPGCGVSSSATLAQAETATPFICRPNAPFSSHFIAAPELIHRPVPPIPLRAHTGRPRRELTFGGVTASFTALHRLYLVYLI